MNASAESLMRLKRNDRTIQIVMAIIALGLTPFTMLFSLYLLGITHALSTLFWLVKMRSAPMLPARKSITVINLVVVVGWLSTMAIDTEYIWHLSGAMIWIGAVLGTLYFILTVREIRYYQKLIPS